VWRPLRLSPACPKVFESQGRIAQSHSISRSQALLDDDVIVVVLTQHDFALLAAAVADKVNEGLALLREDGIQRNVQRVAGELLFDRRWLNRVGLNDLRLRGGTVSTMTSEVADMPGLRRTSSLSRAISTSKILMLRSPSFSCPSVAM